MKKLELTIKEREDALKALDVDLDTVKKVWQPTRNNLVVQFNDGHTAIFKIS